MKLILAAAVALAAGCRQPSPAPPPTASAPAVTTAPPETPSDSDSAARIDLLGIEGRNAAAERDIARLRKTIGELKAVRAGRNETVRRRDELVAAFEGELTTLLDALHRFLFVELSDMPAERRKQTLDDAEAGRIDPIDAPAAALAETVFATGKPYLLSTAELRGNSTDPATGLPVRYAGPITDPWKARFNTAYNAGIRRLAAKTPRTAPTR